MTWHHPVQTHYRTALAKLGEAAQWCLGQLRESVVRRRLLIIVAAVLVCAYALAVLGYVLSIPDMGLRCAFSPTVSHVYPDYAVLPESQSNLDLNSYLKGRRIEKIGDYEVNTWPRLLRGLTHAPDQVVDGQFSGTPPSDPSLTCIELDGAKLVKVQFSSPEGAKSGETESFWFRLGRPPLESLVPSILWFFLKGGLFVVGALVFWKRPGDRSAAQFFLLCTITFGAYMGGYHWQRLITQPLLELVFMVCSMLLPAVSLHFYLVFPRPKTFYERWPGRTLLLIYGPATVFLAPLISAYLTARWLFNAGATTELDLLLRGILNEVYVYFGISSLWYLASVICLVHSYRTARDHTEHNQVKWILFGALAAMVPFGYSLYLAFMEQQSFGGGAATWPMFAASACFTVAFTISITRYRLMQLDQIISSGMVYFLISAAVGVVYFAVLLILQIVVGRRLSFDPSVQALWVSVTALGLLLVLDLVRSRIKSALDRHYHREKHQLDRTLQRMSEAVAQLVDPPALARRLLGASAELLGVERGAIYLRDGEAPLYRLADHLGPAPPLTELSSGCPLIEALQARGTLLAESHRHAVMRARPNGFSGFDGRPAQRQLQFVGGELAHALIHEGQMRALLVLGPKGTGLYGADDVNLLAAFAQITVLALVGAEGHRTIETLNRDLQAKVEKIGEQQRRILALQSQLMKQGSGARGQAAEQKAPDGSPPASDPTPLTTGANGIIGSSPQVRELLQLVKKVSASELAVLLHGESGTGKELLARAIHESSPRAGKPYVKVHCAALSASLLESELFGHVKGAFTGAHRDKIGRFELANGGTLFLDEIGDISLEVQTKLLRVLQEKTFERVGSSDPVQVDVRVLAATHQDLGQLIALGRFREDLYYRLNGFPIVLPPLRQRREDIPELAQHFLRQYCQRCGKELTQIDDDALARLKAYYWPGNIRQLENVIERAVVIVEGPVITEYELPPEILDAELEPDAPSENGAVPDTLSGGLETERAERDRQEKERLVRALAAAAGNKAEAARALRLARSTLVSRLKKHGLS
jgi:transcriptional regulator with GAF, ATPase, and Fis domain